jgi:chemotaxis protein methyltransferase CheR
VIKIRPDELSSLSQYIYTLCGVHLDQTKGYLLESRLAPLLSENNCGSFSDLHMKARTDPTKNLPRKIIDAVTTGETSFFRDTSPFDLFQYKLLPELIDRRRATTLPNTPIPLRIWSAACSSGQEVYTLAMILKETLENTSRYNIRLLGTDVSDQAIKRASYGIFSASEIGRGLTTERLQRYFQPVQNGWKVQDELRAMASFKRINLLEDFSALGRFDIIFCRNVAIYFTENDKVRMFSRLGNAMAPDGALIIGSTESLTGLTPQFEAMRYMRSIYYRLKSFTL